MINPLHRKLNNRKITLASGSPRRKMLLDSLGLKFQVTSLDIEEVYPDHLKGHQITDYLAKLKASAYKARLEEDEICITADTIVWFEDKVLGKPGTPEEAMDMLAALSGKWHEVFTSFSLTTRQKQHINHAKTRVKMRELTPEEIQFYVTQYTPLDKAGSYGIQEWIGLIGVQALEGSYTNVVGLPTAELYTALIRLASLGNA